MSNYLFTSESVTEGHSDKIADQISDAILDYLIDKDKNARVACETIVSNGICLITGEIRTEAYAPIQDIAREVFREIGYTDSSYGFDYRSAGVMSAIGEQSSDITSCFKNFDDDMKASDQGLMFGYATNETEEFMPLAISLAHKLTKRLAEVRKSGVLPYLRPDGKAQVTVEYENNKPKRVHTVVISAQHSSTITNDLLINDIIDDVIKEVIPNHYLDENTKYYINPTGRFVIGGPQADAGLTGRKIIVDTYGGACPHGGGAFSGKDPSKMDRSAAYMARYIAKNIVAAKICEKITIQLSYAINVKEPISIMVDSHNSSIYSNEKIIELIKEVFPLTPKGIIDELNLLRPIYKDTAVYGHFGRENENFTWERVDKVKILQKLIKN